LKAVYMSFRRYSGIWAPWYISRVECWVSVHFWTFSTWARTNNVFTDNIESNISSVAVDTSRAAEELTTAHEYQRKAGRRAACLLIIVVIVVAIVLLAVSPFTFLLIASHELTKASHRPMCCRSFHRYRWPPLLTCYVRGCNNSLYCYLRYGHSLFLDRSPGAQSFLWP